jgi:hypothetical protein
MHRLKPCLLDGVGHRHVLFIPLDIGGTIELSCGGRFTYGIESRARTVSEMETDVTDQEMMVAESMRQGAAKFHWSSLVMRPRIAVRQK